MAEFKIKTADFVFGVRSRFDAVKDECRDYLTDENPVTDFFITEEDIAFERQGSIVTALAENRAEPHFSDEQLEAAALHRKIAEYIPEFGAWVFHGALIEYEGVGYLFTAKSGTGKTTHILNWCRHFKNVHIINGDKPILKLQDDGIYGYGTPWCGKEHWQSNSCVRLKAVVELTRALENHIEPLDFGNIIPVLLNQSYSPAEKSAGKMLDNICSMEGRCEFYRLGCNMDETSAEVAYRGMNSYGVEQ